MFDFARALLAVVTEREIDQPAFPQLHALLERRQAITRRCEGAQGRIIAHVFHRSGNPTKSLRRAWKAACTDAGRPGLLLHDLRRSAVRNLERAGISGSVAMKAYGSQDGGRVQALRDRCRGRPP